MGVRGADEGSRRILDLDGHDAYDVLDIDPQAAEPQIVAAYRRAMSRAHPDTGGSADQAKLVNCAFDVLTRHRTEYDRYRFDLRAGMIGNLASDPRSARAEAAPGGLRVTQVGPNGVLRFSWLDVEDGDAPEPVGPGPGGSAGDSRAADPRDRFGFSEGPPRVRDEHLWGPEDHVSRPDEELSRPGEHVSGPDEHLSRPDDRAGGPLRDDGSIAPAGPRPGAGAQFAAFAAGARRVRSARSAAGIPRRVLPVAIAAAALALAAAAVVGIRGSERLGGQAPSSAVGAWTTSQLSASALPSLAPPAPSPTTPAADLSLTSTGTAALFTVAAEAAVGPHSCQVHADGSLWCAGSNLHGELGDGTTTNRATAVRVGAAGVRWSAVVVGPAGTCARQSDNSLWCWGDDTFGELGNGSFVQQTRPSPVDPGTAWLAVDLYTHTCGVRIDHSLWCWGANSRGELGDGTTTDRPSPRRVGLESSWETVTVGAGTTCAVRQDGTRQCWGHS